MTRTTQVRRAKWGRDRIKMKQQLSEAQNHRCCYCHEPFSSDRESPLYATWEHVIPKSRGGSDALSNFVLACSTCNNIRGARYSAEDFSYLMHNGHLGFLMSEMHLIFDRIKSNEELAA